MLYDLLLNTLVYVFPAYVANATPVIVGRLLPKTHPLDGGRKLGDGRRILGDGKTIEGFVAGVASGIATGMVLAFIGLHAIDAAVALSLGAMIGDSLGSFIKRRLGKARGDRAPLLDELTFIVVALALAFASSYPPHPLMCFTAILITALIHRATNWLAYKMGLKNRPW